MYRVKSVQRSVHALFAAVLLLPGAMGFAAEEPGQLNESVVEPDYSSWYPRTTRSEQGTVVIYAPQIESWTEFETLTAWVAFNVTRATGGEAYYGSLKFTASTDTDLKSREVLLHGFEIESLTIKGIDEDSAEYELASSAFASRSRKVPLDLVLEYLPHEIPLASNDALNTRPPQIFVATEPALLLGVDSEPVFLPIDDTDLQFVLNTNWDVFRSGNEDPLYLCYGEGWLTADGMDGPWSWASSLPAAFNELPAGANWDNARACLPERLDRIGRTGKAPIVFYSTESAELLQFEGQPDWTEIEKTGLSFAANTKQEVFATAGQFFTLLSGRWFAASEMQGPWTYAATLPEAFQQIPPERAHPKSYVRKSVPGTQEAWEAALVASIPRKAEIARGTEEDLDLNVSYGGEPVFQAIEGTGIDMAMNTSYQVFEYQDTYYVCHNAVWLTGKSPEGPWAYAEEMPDEFSKIPPSSPAYNTTFVSVEQSDWETIQYSYTSGYESAYISNDTVVHGTGFAVTAASAWLVYEAFDDDYGYGYPYYPWPPTYGYGSWYDPDNGRYGETIVGYGPYGAAGSTAVFNPETGVYARGQAVWDSDEFAGRSYAYNPNTNTGIARNRYVDFEDDEGWSNRVARRGDEWRYTESEWEDGEMRTEFESSLGMEGEIRRERDGDSVESSGTIRYEDGEATFQTERERDGDQISGAGTLTGENRSVDFESEFEQGQGTVSFRGSEGGTGELHREIEDGEISGSSSFTRDGKTIESDTTRTAEGVKREFETSEGGQGTAFRRGDENAFAYQSGSGDIYAGRDGEVYQKTGESWNRVENPRGDGSVSSANSNSVTPRTASGEPRGSRSGTQLESTVISASSRSNRGAAAGRSGSGNRAGTGDYSQLKRDYQSRQRGYDRYSRYQSAAGRSRTAAPGRLRRR